MKKIILIVLMMLVAFTIYADTPTPTFTMTPTVTPTITITPTPTPNVGIPTYSDIKHIYIVKNPDNLKLVSLLTHPEAFFIRFLRDEDDNYWYGLHFTQPLINGEETYSKLTATSSSNVYDIGINTGNAIYQEIFEGIE